MEAGILMRRDFRRGQYQFDSRLGQILQRDETGGVIGGEDHNQPVADKDLGRAVRDATGVDYGLHLALIGRGKEVAGRTLGQLLGNPKTVAHLVAKKKVGLLLQLTVLASLLIIMLITYIAMLTAIQIHRFLGVTGVHVVTRIFGMLLSALAIQFIFDGIAQSSIFAG